MALNFREKLGPLPIWLWGVIGAGVGLVGYYVFYARRQGDGAQTGASTSVGSNFDATGVEANPGYQTTGFGNPVQGDSGIPENNVQWLARASRGVADATGASPSSVNAALQKYLQGGTLSKQEKDWVDKAIQLFMSPPEGTQGIATSTKTLVRIQQGIGSGGTTKVYDDGSTWVYPTRAEYYAEGSPPVVWINHSGKDIVKFIRVPNGTVYSVDTFGNTEKVSWTEWQRVQVIAPSTPLEEVANLSVLPQKTPAL